MYACGISEALSLSLCLLNPLPLTAIPNLAEKLAITPSFRAKPWLISAILGTYMAVFFLRFTLTDRQTWSGLIMMLWSMMILVRGNVSPTEQMDSFHLWEMLPLWSSLPLATHKHTTAATYTHTFNTTEAFVHALSAFEVCILASYDIPLGLSGPETSALPFRWIIKVSFSSRTLKHK